MGINKKLIQTNIYDFLGLENDPLFNQIKQLKKGKEVELQHTDIVLRCNIHGIYELENNQIHEQADNLTEFYYKVLQTQYMLRGCV